MTRRRGRQRRRQQGFNLLEVMIAMVVLMAAVLATTGLSATTMRSNMAARNRATAMEFLQGWVERLKMDAMAWQPGTAAPSLLENHVDGQWFIPTEAELGEVGQASADFWGVDVDPDDSGDMRYCVNLRAEPLIAGSAVRADVRVWWHREGGSALTDEANDPIVADRSLVTGCGTAGTAPIDDPRVYSITMSTILTPVSP